MDHQWEHWTSRSVEQIPPNRLCLPNRVTKVMFGSKKKSQSPPWLVLKLVYLLIKVYIIILKDIVIKSCHIHKYSPNIEVLSFQLYKLELLIDSKWNSFWKMKSLLKMFPYSSLGTYCKLFIYWHYITCRSILCTSKLYLF